MVEIPSNLVLRKLRKEDESAARELILKGLEEHWGWLDSTQNPDLDSLYEKYADAEFILAWNAGRLVGSGALVPLDSRVGKIVRMSVARQMRRQRIGQQILEALYQRACALGLRQIILETTASWTDAVQFYTHFGFIPDEIREGDQYFHLDLPSTGRQIE